MLSDSVVLYSNSCDLEVPVSFECQNLVLVSGTWQTCVAIYAGTSARTKGHHYNTFGSFCALSSREHVVLLCLLRHLPAHKIRS